MKRHSTVRLNIAWDGIVQQKQHQNYPSKWMRKKKNSYGSSRIRSSLTLTLYIYERFIANVLERKSSLINITQSLRVTCEIYGLTRCLHISLSHMFEIQWVTFFVCLQRTHSLAHSWSRARANTQTHISGDLHLNADENKLRQRTTREWKSFLVLVFSF